MVGSRWIRSGVVVDPEEVERLRNQLRVLRMCPRRVRTEVFQDIRRILPAQQASRYQRTSKPSSRDACSLSAAESVAAVHRREIEDDAHIELAARAAHRLRGEAVAQQAVMRDLHRHRPVLDPRCEMSQLVADGRRHPRFIVSRERAHAIAADARATSAA